MSNSYDQISKICFIPIVEYYLAIKVVTDATTGMNLENMLSKEETGVRIMQKRWKGQEKKDVVVGKAFDCES